MATFVDLEIGLRRASTNPGFYSVELRLSHESEADRRWVRPFQVNLDFEVLRQAALDVKEYGQLLGKSLFESTDMQRAFAHARATAEAHNVPLRMRLFIEHGAAELHELRWETLRDPDLGTPLLTDEHILFSRYLSSWDWQPIRARARTQLKALVVIANPTNLANYQPGGQLLAPVDVAGELERARAAMRELQVEELASGGRATLNEVLSRLRDGHDILYLVAHGAVIRGESWLWLEEPSGATARVSGSELVQRMSALEIRPRLVVLASCQSAGAGPEASGTGASAFVSLGPRLAEAGIPAVLAMQGDISMQTVAKFMPVFFTELQRDGQIDRAVTAARAAVVDRPDWWMPVLFMRLKSGRIWYVPGFGVDPRGFEKWPALLEFIRDRKCTPFLGPGVLESLLGTWRELARAWAETYHFPMAPYQCDDLSEVAQFLAVNQARSFPRSRLEKNVREEILRRFQSVLPITAQEATLDELFSLAGAAHRKNNPAEPHQVLAQLPCPIYINTNSNNLLFEALRAAGKAPRVEFCRWKEELEMYPLLKDQEPGYTPDHKNPLVFHLFGRRDIPESLVFTQDDLLDFLIGYTRNKELVPEAVRRALSMSALLFIGFQLDTLHFRVLFRTIISQEGGSRLRDFAHVAAQVDPEEGRLLEPEGARKYLESYFLKSAEVSLYWGSTDDFMKDLLSQWKASHER